MLLKPNALTTMGHLSVLLIRQRLWGVARWSWVRGGGGCVETSLGVAWRTLEGGGLECQTRRLSEVIVKVALGSSCNPRRQAWF